MKNKIVVVLLASAGLLVFNGHDVKATQLNDGSTTVISNETDKPKENSKVQDNDNKNANAHNKIDEKTESNTEEQPLTETVETKEQPLTSNTVTSNSNAETENTTETAKETENKENTDNQKFQNVNIGNAADNDVWASWNDEEKKLVITGTGTLNGIKYDELFSELIKAEKIRFVPKERKDDPTLEWTLQIKDPLKLSDNHEGKELNYLPLLGDLPPNFKNITENQMGVNFIKGNKGWKPSYIKGELNVANIRGNYYHPNYNAHFDFNPNIDTSNVKDMSDLFLGDKYLPDVSKWDTSNVERMDYTFANTGSTPDVSKWNTSNVATLNHTFESSLGNPDVSNWDVKNVISMAGMFAFTKNASPDMSKWNLQSLSDSGRGMVFEDTMDPTTIGGPYAFYEANMYNAKLPYIPEESNPIFDSEKTTVSIDEKSYPTIRKYPTTINALAPIDTWLKYSDEALSDKYVFNFLDVPYEFINMNTNKVVYKTILKGDGELLDYNMDSDSMNMFTLPSTKFWKELKGKYGGDTVIKIKPIDINNTFDIGNVNKNINLDELKTKIYLQERPSNSLEALEEIQKGKIPLTITKMPNLETIGKSSMELTYLDQYLVKHNLTVNLNIISNLDDDIKALPIKDEYKNTLTTIYNKHKSDENIVNDMRERVKTLEEVNSSNILSGEQKENWTKILTREYNHKSIKREIEDMEKAIEFIHKTGGEHELDKIKLLNNTYFNNRKSKTLITDVVDSPKSRRKMLDEVNDITTKNETKDDSTQTEPTQKDASTQTGGLSSKGVDVSTQTDKVPTADASTQTDKPNTADASTQTDNKGSKPKMVDVEVQTNNKVMVDKETQTEDKNINKDKTLKTHESPHTSDKKDKVDFTKDNTSVKNTTKRQDKEDNKSTTSNKENKTIKAVETNNSKNSKNITITDNTKQNTSKSVETNDNTNIFNYVTMLGASMLGFVALLKKRKNNNQ